MSRRGGAALRSKPEGGDVAPSVKAKNKETILIRKVGQKTTWIASDELKAERL